MLATRRAEREGMLWRVRTTVERFDGDLAEYIAALGKAAGEAEFHRALRPFDREVVVGNLLVTTGIQIIFDLLTATGSPVAYNAANAYIGVGTGTTAAAAGDTALTSGVRKGMDSSFPSRSGATQSWKSSFTSAEANQAWNEWGIFNNATAGTMLNHKVESLGTKASGTWTLQVDATLS